MESCPRAQAQLLWIAGLVQAAAAARRRPAALLVFGLGFDSDVWASVNCGGRTAFLENYQVRWVGVGGRRWVVN